MTEEQDQVGQVTGLAWTEVGGELLKIESAVMPGKGKTIITGHLGEVMQESIQAAMTVVRSVPMCSEFQINFSKKMIFMYMYQRVQRLKMVQALVLVCAQHCICINKNSCAS